MDKKVLIQKIEEEIGRLVDLSDEYVEQDVGIDKIELSLLSELLKLGLLLLNYIIKQKLKKVEEYLPILESGESYRSKGTKKRNYLSLFGLIQIHRPSYLSTQRGQFYKIDDYLQLPKGCYWSYNLQELVGGSATQGSYKESVVIVNKLLGLNLSGKSSERNVNHLGEYVDQYYELEREEAQEDEALFFSTTFDGKGLPKIKAVQQKEANPKKRLSKGEKKGKKQSATVSVTSVFTPQQRTADQILDGLMGVQKEAAQEDEPASTQQKKTENKMHTKIHRRAFLANQQKAIDYGIEDLKSKMTNSQSRFVIPIDAGIGLEDKILASIKKNNLEGQFDGIILDIVHVSEYVWDCANAIFGESSKLRTSWVRGVLKDILEGGTEKVIKDLVLNRDKTELSTNKKKQLNKAITYLTNHKHKMNYADFLKKGYPISSALAESTCKLRWSKKSGHKNKVNLCSNERETHHQKAS